MHPSCSIYDGTNGTEKFHLVPFRSLRCRSASNGRSVLPWPLSKSAYIDKPKAGDALQKNEKTNSGGCSATGQRSALPFLRGYATSTDSWRSNQIIKGNSPSNFPVR